ncbi:hypothetical protein FPQ18DRAFT_360714 [Pyronema domesticum]|nr:hypothetical protein FPQ18DRAFT_360714 [Pyronema domesticum]
MQRLVLFPPLRQLIQVIPTTLSPPRGNPSHASPSFSFFCCCVRKCLIEGPQHSSVRSFVSAHDPMRRPCFPAAAHRRSAHYTSPSGEHHLPLLRTESSFVGHSVSRTNKHSSAPTVVLAYDPMRQPCSPRDSAPALSSLQSCLRGKTTCLASAQCSALSQALLEGLPTLPRLPRRSRVATQRQHLHFGSAPALNTHTFFPSASVLRALLPLSTATGPDRPIHRGLDRWMTTQIPPTSPEALGELTTTFWESAGPPCHGGR